MRKGASKKTVQKGDVVHVMQRCRSSVWEVKAQCALTAFYITLFP